MNRTIRLHIRRVFHAQHQLANPRLVALLGLGVVCLAPVANAQGTYAFTRSFTDSLTGPDGVAVNRSGDVFAGAFNAGKVVEFSGSGSVLNTINTGGPFTPYGVAVDSSGNLFVSNKNNSQVVKFNSSGSVLTTFGSIGYDGITLDSSGNLFAADYGGSRIDEFTSSGSFVKSIGSTAHIDGPLGVAVDSSGNVYVADGSSHHQIDVYNSSGAFVREFGNAQISQPTGVALDAAGDVFVSDGINNRIEEFNNSGTYLQSIGSFGTGPGQLKQPGDVFVDGGGDLFVADLGNNRVEEFSTTPEPGSLAVLVGVGVAGSLALRRRRRNRRSTMASPVVLQATVVGHKPRHFTIPSQQHSSIGRRVLCILSFCLDQTCSCLERAFDLVGPLARSVSRGDVPEGRDGVCS